MTTTILIKGMHCASCKALIEDVASDVKGVTSCEVDPATGMGRIEHGPEFSFPELAKAVGDLGEYMIERV